jgi:hypothetical protein
MTRLTPAALLKAYAVDTRIVLCAAYLLSFNAARAESSNTTPPHLEVGNTSLQQTILKTPDLTLATLRSPSQYSLLLSTSGGQTGRISMPKTPWNVSIAAEVVDGKVIVDLPLKDGGSVLFGVNRMFVLGSKPPALLDQFRCENPALSPNGKLLSFLAYYPPHFARESVTGDFVMLYDLAKTALGNRNSPRSNFPLNDISDRRVGLQAYPIFRPAGERGDAANGSTWPVHTIYDQTWSQDSSKLLFRDEVEPITSSRIGQTTGSGSLGNLRPSAKTGEPERFLVLINVKNSGLMVRRVRSPSCPAISGSRCVLELKAATFGADGIAIPQHITGQVNKELTLHIAYGDFQAVR